MPRRLRGAENKLRADSDTLTAASKEGSVTMNGSTKRGRIIRFALFVASVALIIAGCATTASYRPEIDSMKTALAEAKAAGAEARAPEAYAAAEACLDWMTHEATEFKPFADPDARIRGKCQAAFTALREKMAAAPVMRRPKIAQTESVAEEKASPLKDIFFDFDRSSIPTEMKKSLVENVRWLKAHQGAAIII